MKHTTYEIEEEWEAACGGSLYAAPKGEKPRDWKLTAACWPKSLGNDVVLGELVGFTLEGSARHLIPFLRTLLEQAEMMDESYAEDMDSTRSKP